MSQQAVAGCFEVCVPLWQTICSGSGGPGTGFEEDWGGSLTKPQLNSNMSKFMDYEAFKTGIPVCQ